VINRSQSLLHPFPWIWTGDPALDNMASTFSAEKYIDTGDRVHLPLKEGGIPTEFQLTPLSRVVYQYVVGFTKERWAEGLAEALAYGLRSVANFDDGKPLPVKHVTDHRGERASADVLDTLFNAGGLSLITELGHAILRRSVPGPLSK
jgi:hypothetical protein